MTRGFLEAHIASLAGIIFGPDDGLRLDINLKGVFNGMALCCR